MEFNKKLQELRKERGLTQEELASALYVSRTAISKWESGRGYPSIDSLRSIAAFFSVSLDSLLSSDDVITIAQSDQREKKISLCTLVFGLTDLSYLLLLFLPFFSTRTDGAAVSVNLLSGGTIQEYLKILYFAVIGTVILFGITELALQSVQNTHWTNLKSKISIFLGIISVALFTVSLQPYAAIFAFALLTIKASLLIKWH